MVQQVQEHRTATPQRWATALNRALDAALDIYQVADTGERFVTSASQQDIIHRTDGVSCSCAAAVSGDPVCSHRAVVRFVMGTLPAVVVPISDLVAAGVVERCKRCFGQGEYWAGSVTDGDSRRIVCPICQGEGVITAPSAHLQAA